MGGQCKHPAFTFRAFSARETIVIVTWGFTSGFYIWRFRRLE
jgi:hypothetical protein